MTSYPTVDATTGKKLPNPSIPLGISYKPNSATFTSDSGLTQVRAKGKLKRTFTLTYPVLLLTQWTTLRNFYISMNGDVTAFTFTDPVEKSTYTVRFSGELTGKNIGHNGKTALYSAEIKLEEVL